MEGVIWVFAIVFGIATVQWLVFRRLQRDAGDGGLDLDPDEVPRSELLLSWEERSDGGGDSLETPEPLADGRTRCPRCGADNEGDPAYTYCWNCLGPVG